MAENSKIEWTHHTANLWWGCTKVHTGCDHCYAEGTAKRWGFDVWGNDKPRREIASVWTDFERMQKKAAAAGEVHRVFVGSMMDIFEKSMPVYNKDKKAVWSNTGHMRDRFFDRVIPESPNLLFLLLTKRPSNINKMIPAAWITNGAPSNVMFGTSPVDQETADKLIPQLLQVKGKRFLSIEPMLEKINLNDLIWQQCENCNGSGSLPVMENGECVGGMPCPICLEPYQGKISGINWIICGGESGGGKRPFNPDWARSLRGECHTAKIPFFMKQWDKIKAIPEDLLIREFPHKFNIKTFQIAPQYKAPALYGK